MGRIKQFFLSIILILIFFGFGGQKVLATENIKKWPWSGDNACWNESAQYKKSINFTITADMLTDGKFLASVTGYAKNGHTFMYFDAEDELNEVLDNGECYVDGEPVPALSKMIFHTFDLTDKDSVFPVEKHDFGALAVESNHTLSCWGFANSGYDGEGDCSFGLEPSCTLTANPSGNIPIDGSSTLSWTSKEALSAAISPGNAINTFDLASGSIIVNLPSSGIKIYTMTVNGAASVKTCQTSVTVVQPSCIFSATPPSISYGNKAMLSWKTEGITSATIDNGNDNEGDDANLIDLPNGTRYVTPLIKTTYKMIATGPNGKVPCSDATVDVVAAPPESAGLIPCARITDNLNTLEINESAPCDICALFYMLKNVINFALTMSIGVGVFVFVLIGLLYVFSGGNISNISLAKTAIASVISGISIVFIAWVAIAIILQAFGFGSMSKWNQVSCGLTATPSQVRDLAIAVGDNQVTLTWAPPLENNGGYDILHYHVYCGVLPNPTTICNIGSPSGDNVMGTSFVHTGLTNGETYYYKVLAVNQSGEGSQPGEVSTMSDCSAADTNAYQSRTVATDVDYDGYSTAAATLQCVGASAVMSNGKTYYKNSAGNYQFIDAASISGSNDCDDSNDKKWRLRYLDSDNDNYCTTPKNAPVCVGNEPNYKDSCSCFTDSVKDITETGNTACYYRDCNPSDNTRWRYRYLDYDGDTYGNEFIDIYGTSVTKNLGPLFCVGAHPTYVDIIPDCKPNNHWIYQLKSVVNDSDQDGYTITNKDRYLVVMSPLPVPIDPEFTPVPPVPVKIGDADIPFVAGCVGDLVNPLVKNTNSLDRKYYRNEKEVAAGGGFFYVDSSAGNWLNRGSETDCNPNDTYTYRKRDVATDVDHDGFPFTVITEQCVGDSKVIEGIDGIKRTYYKKTENNTDSDFIYLDKASVNKYPLCQAQLVIGNTVCAGIGGTCSSSTCGGGCTGSPAAIGPCGCTAQCTSTGDCDDTNAFIYQNQNVATDEDQDGHSTSGATSQCVGSSIAVSGRIYFKNSVGKNYSILSGSIIGASDCADSNITGNSNIFQTLNVTTDADHDNYSIPSTSAVSTCVGDPSPTLYNGRTYYKNSIGTYPFMVSSPAGTDCDDSTDTKWRLRYSDADIDTYGAGSQVCVGDHPNHVDNNTDCDNNNTKIYQTLNVAIDADHDGYSIESLKSKCAGSSTVINERTYYKDSTGAYPFIATGILGTGDCNDSDATLNANLSYYCDGDSDTFINKTESGSICSLSAPSGCDTAPGTDCNDGDEDINPGIAEICDGAIDNNCDGSYNTGVVPKVGCIGNCGIIGNQDCNSSGIWGACSTASSCDNDPICSPLSQTVNCPLVGGKIGTKTQTRSQVCCGGCSGWSAWGDCK